MSVMVIKWNNVGVVVLLLGEYIVYAKWHGYLQEAFGCIAHISSGNTPEDRMFGTIVLGLLCLTFVCIVKLLRKQ